MNDEKEDPQAQSWQKTILKKIGSKLLECMNPAAASHFAQRGDKMVLRRQVFLTFLGHCHCDAAAAVAVNPVCTKCDLQTAASNASVHPHQCERDLFSIISMSSLTSGSQFSLMARLGMMTMKMVCWWGS